MFYSHDGFGLGHFHRNVVLARALVDRHPGVGVLLACGVEAPETTSLPSGVDLLRLPGLQKLDNGRYEGRRLGMGSMEVVTLRKGLLSTAVELFRPDVLVADKYPVGACGELLPALLLQRREGRRAALGLRDVFDDPRRAAEEWSAAGCGLHVAELHDLVLVYGTPTVLNPLRSGMLPPTAAARVRFCGYVVDRAPVTEPRPADMPEDHPKPLVLACVGGGEDGFPVLEAFIEASRGAHWRGALVAGPMMEPSPWARLEAQAHAAGVLAYRSVQHLDRWFPHVAALICMGGYNTLLQAVSSGTPVVCVPRTRPRTEQLIRAQAFAAKGLLRIMEPESLTSSGLAGAVRSALETPRTVLADRCRTALDLGGSDRAASLLLDLAQRPRPVVSEPHWTPIGIGHP